MHDSSAKVRKEVVNTYLTCIILCFLSLFDSNISTIECQLPNEILNLECTRYCIESIWSWNRDWKEVSEGHKSREHWNFDHLAGRGSAVHFWTTRPSLLERRSSRWKCPISPDHKSKLTAKPKMSLEVSNISGPHVQAYGKPTVSLEVSNICGPHVQS
jgi:hypothetical protein